ncbi:hypothetical protein GCM10010303_83940 [Streptomyces purpurascens]|nr:hypothetical protein GCM10010303_83940 [Streptomyces purpurascens]
MNGRKEPASTAPATPVQMARARRTPNRSRTAEQAPAGERREQCDDRHGHSADVERLLALDDPQPVPSSGSATSHTRTGARTARAPNVMLYWLTATAGSAAPMYYEGGRYAQAGWFPLTRSEVPTAVANSSATWPSGTGPNKPTTSSAGASSTTADFAALEAPTS